MHHVHRTYLHVNASCLKVIAATSPMLVYTIQPYCGTVASHARHCCDNAVDVRTASSTALLVRPYSSSTSFERIYTFSFHASHCIVCAACHACRTDVSRIIHTTSTFLFLRTYIFCPADTANMPFYLLKTYQ